MVFAGVVFAQDSTNTDRKSTYVEAVTNGDGLMPWQDAGPSPQEATFRAEIEARKDAMLAGRVPTEHPVMLDADARETLRRRIENTEWGAEWFQNIKAQADNLVSQPDGYIENMIPELTPTNPYGFTCPSCVGVKSQEGVGGSLYGWSSANPDQIECKACGQVYPDPNFPETAVLQAPRMGQTLTFYRNDAERANPEDRSGALAWHWVGHPIHVSFTGIIREHKILHMRGAVNTLAFAYWLTEEPRYAEMGIEILVRLAECYRNWLYHDYWNAYADCDPLYAAWHDMNLPLEWKRHLCTDVYAKDTLEQARMEQNYWGAGRIHPSTDAISGVVDTILAYDLLHDARDENGASLWTDENRARVERDFFLEYVMGAEPYLGGAGKADSANNKAPRLYNAFAAVGKCLGLPQYADVALRGYERVRDESFLYDGFSKESPAYTNMYLSQLIAIPETLHGFQWPADFAGRSGTVNYFESDERLALMFHAVIDQLHPSGRYLPLSDTNASAKPNPYILEVGAKRYPERYAGVLHALRGNARPTDYGLLHLPEAALRDARTVSPPEIYFPAWMNAILRHGEGDAATVVSLAFSPSGGHRHYDNLALYYAGSDATYLGDHGYVGDMPVNRWIKSTQSHNLVIVDDSEQDFGGRMPSLHWMTTTPQVSAVEASSTAYPQCSDYRRTLLVLKGADGQNVLVDIFRVTGGKKHAYRIFSEIAASNSTDCSLEFAQLDMPPEPPLPEVGSSLADEDIFGLRDVRTADNPPASWQATWRDAKHGYRLWMLSPVTRVEASNGPGQKTDNDAGRRVRYVDAIREGENALSTFVAVHEPWDAEDAPRIRGAELLKAPVDAGPDAVALRVDAAWGSYLILTAFETAQSVENVSFQGDLGIVHRGSDDAWLWTLGASQIDVEGQGFSDATPRWIGDIQAASGQRVTTSTTLPADWPDAEESATVYVRVKAGDTWTGLPVASVEDNEIMVDRFPVTPDADAFDLPAWRIVNLKSP
jgi:hypothetical protein